jgi:pyridoxal phosphate enzyme (YggS family)
MMMPVSENFKIIKAQIATAARDAGRAAADITLVAVSKMQPDERVRAALEYGQRVFGENRVQEAQERWLPLKKEYDGVTLHLIGPLQTNKVKEAVALFDVIETVDREKLVHALADEMKKQGRFLPCFIQVNIGDEDQKAGVSIEGLPGLLAVCRQAELTIDGLMCIPPVDEPPAFYFALLQKLARELGLKNLSMGMSGDFEKAIALGATHVRVGSALFGSRF